MAGDLEVLKNRPCVLVGKWPIPCGFLFLWCPLCGLTAVFFNRYHISGRGSRATGGPEPGPPVGDAPGPPVGDGSVGPRMADSAECRLQPATTHGPSKGSVGPGQGLPRAAALALNSTALSVMQPGSVATALLVTMLVRACVSAGACTYKEVVLKTSLIPIAWHDDAQLYVRRGLKPSSSPGLPIARR